MEVVEEGMVSVEDAGCVFGCWRLVIHVVGSRVVDVRMLDMNGNGDNAIESYTTTEMVWDRKESTTDGGSWRARRTLDGVQRVPGGSRDGVNGGMRGETDLRR